MDSDRGATLSWDGDGDAATAAPVRDASARYELREELGRGGMAVVHAAFDRELDRVVALKLLRPERVRPGDHARLVREAQTLAKLRHPNVVVVFDIGSLGGRVFIAMERVDGVSLRAWLATERPWREVVRVFAAAGRGLAAAHAAGIAHRDFKLDNVLVDRDGVARVADFGLARLGEDAPDEEGDAAAPTLTRTGTLAGTLPYLAPELLDGAVGDARADQFAFGVSLAEALSGTRPFAGATAEELRAAQARGAQLAPNIPAHLRQVIERSLATDPALRFASLTELVAALERDPARRRMRVAIGASVFAIGALTASIVALGLRTPEAPSCTLAGLDGVWDDARRSAWSTHVAASTAPEAATIGASTRARLDAYAASLQQAERAACTAAPRESAQLGTLRAACLLRARAELRALVEQLLHADAATLARAPNAVGGLGKLEACASAEDLLRPDIVPRDPVIAARVAALRAELAFARALRIAGKAKDSLAQLQAMRLRARELGHKPTEAEVMLQLALAQEQIAMPPAEPLLREALALAQAGHHDDVVGRAAMSLALNVGRGQERPEEGIAWAELALSTSERLGKPADLESGAHFALAVIANGKHDAATAEREGQIALRIGEAADLDPLVRAGYLNTLGGAALERGDLAEAQRRYAASLALVEPIVGEINVQTLAARSNLASVYFALGDIPRALAVREQLVLAREQLMGPSNPRLGEDRITLAYVLAEAGRDADAVAEVRRGRAIVAAAKQPLPTLRADLRVAEILFATGAVAEAEALARTLTAPLAELPRQQGKAELVNAQLLLAEIAVAGKRSDAAALLAQVAAYRPAGEALGRLRRLEAQLAREAGDAQRALTLAREARTALAATFTAKLGISGAAILEEGLALVALHQPDARSVLDQALALLVDRPRWTREAAQAQSALAALSPAR